MPRHTVLLIDDNADERELALRAIGRLGFDVDVVCASDGAEALHLLGLSGGSLGALQPDVVLLDIKMPRMTGLEVLQRIRAAADTRHIPVVMMTSSDEPRDIDRCYLQGANSYTVKPIDFGEYSQHMCDIIRYWTGLNRPPACAISPAA